MRSDVLIVARRDRRPRIECSGGLAARDTEPDTVHLVSAAATPLGGDSISVRIVVEPGARLRVRISRGDGDPARAGHGRVACALGLWTWTVNSTSTHSRPSSPPTRGTSRRHASPLADRAASGCASAFRSAEPMSGKASGPAHCMPTSTGQPCCVTASSSARGSVADDELAAPMACISELRYPETKVDTAGMALALARGGLPVDLAGRAALDSPPFSVSCTDAAISSSSSILVRA